MAKKRRNTSGRSHRSRWWFLILLAALIGGAWLKWGDGLRRNGATATAYSARVACSCRFVAGRSLDDCAKDKLDGMELVRLSEDGAAKTVTASIPLLASDSAAYRKGYGCVLKEWEG